MDKEDLDRRETHCIRFHCYNSKSIINVSIIHKRFVHNVSTIHKRFVHSFEKQSFVMADKETHRITVYLPVQYIIIETEFNGGSSLLHQLNKSYTRKRRRSKLAIIQCISAYFIDFCKRNVDEKAGVVRRAEKER